MSRTRVQLGQSIAPPSPAGGALAVAASLWRGFKWIAAAAATAGATKLAIGSEEEFEDSWTDRTVFFDRMRTINNTFGLVNKQMSQCAAFYNSPAYTVFKTTWTNFHNFYNAAADTWFSMSESQATQARDYAAQAVYWARRSSNELPTMCPGVKLYFTLENQPPLSPEEGSVKQQVDSYVKRTTDIEKAKGTFNWERALQWGAIIVLATAGIVAIRFAAGFQRR